jgi:uncharacterized protein (DUF302 family)
MTTTGYGYVRTVSLSFSDAVSKAEAALKKEGFGVLCQIDIQAKLKEKLGVDFARDVILDARNPPLAGITPMPSGTALAAGASPYLESGYDSHR